MRLPTSAFALLFLALPFSALAATPLEIWPDVPTASDVEQASRLLSASTGNRDGRPTSGEGAESLPKALQPAVRFQKLFMKILAGEKSSAWRADMEDFCKQAADTPVAAGLRDVARVWIARAQMEEIDALLHDYYRRNIRFPAKLAELGPLPPSLQTDPWGEAWSYSPTAPQGFSKLAGQRYQLGTARFPKLATLAEAIRDRQPAHVWEITPRDAGGNTALEFHAAQSTAVIQPGGAIEGCRLLFIGDKWALMAGTDQLFAVGF